MTHAAAVLPRPALRTRATRLEHLHRNPVADRDPPSRRRPAPTASIVPTISWPGTKANPARQRACELLVIGAAEPARLDAEDPVVVADRRNRERTWLRAGAAR